MQGVFVAGDVRHGSVKRVSSAVGEGASAIQSVHEYLVESPAESEPGAGALMGSDITHPQARLSSS